MTEEGGQKIYRWTHSNLIIKQKGPGEIPRRIPPKPDIQITTFASWEDVGRWYGDLQKDPLQITPAIQKKADELTKGLKTDDEKIRAIYGFVSLKFHYIGLDFGIGRYQPHAADDVLDNGYGDCKDNHTLLASLLKAAGIEAWPALIHATRKLDPDVPSPAQFNHVITVVPSGDKYVWLDTTPEVAPYGLLLRSLRDKQALVIPVNQAPRLMMTPENPPHPQRQEFSMEGKLSADGVLHGHSEQIYDGDLAVQFRVALRQLPESQWKDAVQRFSYALNFAGDVSNVKVSALDELDQPLTISYDYERKNFGDWENHRTIAALPPLGVEVLKDQKDIKPEEPFPLGALGRIIYRSQVQLPAGYKPELPAACHLSEPYGQYDATSKFERGVLTITRDFQIKKTEVALSEWEGFRKFGRTIADDEYSYITLSGSGEAIAMKGSKKDPLDAGVDEMFPGQKGRVDDIFAEGTSALQNRDFQRAQEMFEKVVSMDPNHKGAHFNLGIALAARNDMPDAVNEFRKEEKISPGDSRPYQVLASLPYADRQAGRSDGRMARIVERRSGEPDGCLDAGRPALRGGEIQRSRAGTRGSRKSSPDSPGLQFQLGEAYAKKGQKEKAIASLRQSIEQKGDDPITLNNVAYTLADNNLNLELAQQYGEKALNLLHQQAQEAGTSRDAGMRVTFDLSLLWDTLGWIYFQQGDVKRAEDFVRPAWLLGEESIVAEHLGEIYEKEGKMQQAAHAYESALAVLSLFNFGPQTDAAKAYRKGTDNIKARYKRLTGKEPSLTEIKRLPNGEWTKTPAEQLRATREVKVRNERKVSGSAEFTVVFKPGNVESAEFSSGDRELEKLAEKLTAAHYPLEFPSDSKAILVLHVGVKCHSSGDCVGTLVNPAPVRFPGSVN